MSTARELTLAQLSGIAPADAQVRAYARLARQPARPTIMVRMDEVEPAEDTSQNARVYRLSLIVLASKFLTDDDTRGGVDAELDDLVEVILDQLDRGTTDLVWTSAKRGVYEPTDSPCYIIAVQITGTYAPESETP